MNFIPQSIQKLAVGLLLVLWCVTFSGCSRRRTNPEKDAKELKTLTYASNLELIKIRKSAVYAGETFELLLQKGVKKGLHPFKGLNIELDVVSHYKNQYGGTLYYPIQSSSMNRREQRTVLETSLLDTIFSGELNRLQQKVLFFYIDASGLMRVYPAADILAGFDDVIDFREESFYKVDSETGWKWFINEDLSGLHSGNQLVLSLPVYHNTTKRGVIGVSISQQNLLRHILKTEEELHLLCSKDGKIITGHPDAFKILGFAQGNRSGEDVFRSKLEPVRKAMKVLFFEENNIAAVKAEDMNMILLSSDLNEIDARLIRVIKNQ